MKLDEFSTIKDDLEKKYRLINDDNYEYTNRTIKLLLEEGFKQLDRLGEVAESTEEARMYEVYFNSLKMIVDATNGVLEQESRRLDNERKQQIIDRDNGKLEKQQESEEYITLDVSDFQRTLNNSPEENKNLVTDKRAKDFDTDQDDKESFKETEPKYVNRV